MTLPRRHPNWIFADTSGYYAGAAEDEQRHEEARAILTQLEREHVRFYTRIETSATTIIAVTADDQANARLILGRRQDKLYSLTDALSFAVMERLGISRVFTFDRTFEQHGFELVAPL